MHVPQREFKVLPVKSYNRKNSGSFAVSSCGMLYKQSLHEALSNCASELELFEWHIDLSQSIGGTLLWGAMSAKII